MGSTGVLLCGTGSCLRDGSLAQHPAWAPGPLPLFSVQNAAAFPLRYVLSTLLPFQTGVFSIYTWKNSSPAHLVFFCSFPVHPVLGFPRLSQMIIALSFMLLLYLCLTLHLAQRKCSLLQKKHSVH